MIDAETDVSLGILSREIPGSPSYHTLRAWAVTGAKGRSGNRVRLPTVKLPSGLGSSIEKYDAFLVMLND